MTIAKSLASPTQSYYPPFPAPVFILGGFLVMAALQSFFSGLILSNLAQKDRRDFEMQLHRCHREKEAGL